MTANILRGHKYTKYIFKKSNFIYSFILSLLFPSTKEPDINDIYKIADKSFYYHKKVREIGKFLE